MRNSVAPAPFQAESSPTSSSLTSDRRQFPHSPSFTSEPSPMATYIRSWVPDDGRRGASPPPPLHQTRPAIPSHPPMTDRAAAEARRRPNLCVVMRITSTLFERAESPIHSTPLQSPTTRKRQRGNECLHAGINSMGIRDSGDSWFRAEAEHRAPFPLARIEGRREVAFEEIHTEIEESTEEKIIIKVWNGH